MQSVNPTDYGMPVYNLQRMLRVIFQTNGMTPEVVPDGIFGETTEAAVKQFQKMQGIEQSGIVDNATWELITLAHERAVIEGNEPIAVQLFAREDFQAESEMPRARLAVLQAMLNVMQLRFSNLPKVEITGVYDAQTADALASYRALFGLPQGGIDNMLWYHFAKAYESAVLPHDFENPEHNKFKPEEARQQIDLSKRTENSMPDAMPEEAVLQDAGTINLQPTLDSYSSLQRADEADGATEPQKVAEPIVQPKAERTVRRTLKWNF